MADGFVLGRGNSRAGAPCSLGGAPWRRILAVRRGALGDFILTLPALRALRESMLEGFQATEAKALDCGGLPPLSSAGLVPRRSYQGELHGQSGEAEIHLLTLPAYGTFAAHFGYAEGWRSLDSAAAATLFRVGAEIPEDWRQWLAGFDRIISWLPDRDGVFQRQLAGCGSAFFCQAPWLAEAAEGKGPAARQFGGLPGLHCRDHELLPFGVLEKRQELIALHPGSGSPRKNWPFACWVEVMAAIQRKRPETRWLLITGEAEADDLPGMSAALNSAGLPWESASGLELVRLAERLRECAALCGHDSGISHLASACGVPCLLLFGPTDPDIWAPAAGNVRVLRAPGGDLSALWPEEVFQWLMPAFLERLAGEGKSSRAGAPCSLQQPDKGARGSGP